MLQTEIKRTKLSAVSVPTGECFPDLAAEAEELLGYSRKGTPTAVRCELAETLARLEIEVLDWRDVLKYQMEEKHAREAKILAQQLVGDELPTRWSRPSVEWTETEIGKYRGFVPDFAIQKALEIKRALPGVRIFIHELTESADPFLMVSDGDRWNGKNTFYIEVWNEPGFEAW